MKCALLMNNNSYAGREYLKALKSHGLTLDVLIIGGYPEINKSEEARCGGLWRPPQQATFHTSFNFFYFKSLEDTNFLEFLESQSYYLCIQGGTGILKQQIINKFSLGILNFHPGKLPQYRGCSAPEWQLYENNSIYCTCHLIDEGIDTGAIHSMKKLEVSFESYEQFRASIYPEVAKFVAKVVEDFQSGLPISFSPQDQKKGVYREYIGLEKINELKSFLDK